MGCLLGDLTPGDCVQENLGTAERILPARNVGDPAAAACVLQDLSLQRTAALGVQIDEDVDALQRLHLVRAHHAHLGMPFLAQHPWNRLGIASRKLHQWMRVEISVPRSCLRWISACRRALKSQKVLMCLTVLTRVKARAVNSAVEQAAAQPTCHRMVKIQAQHLVMA